MSEKQDIKELKEVLDAVFEISLKLTLILKDGYQHSDLVEILSLFTEDKGIREKIAAAADGISKIGGEVGDLDAYEGIEIAQLILAYVPRYVEVFREKKA